MDSKTNQVSINKALEKSSISKTLNRELITEPSQSLSSEISSLTQSLESNFHQIETKSEIKTETLETETLDSDCQTPKELIFDPFRPGPDELAFAPKRKPFRRQLKYDISLFPVSNLNSEFDEFKNNEDKSVEVFCKSFIDLIITKVVDQVCIEGFETPKKGLGFLNGFAETCPPAPLRVDLKSERFDKKGLCRNLELEFDLV